MFKIFMVLDKVLRFYRVSQINSTFRDIHDVLQFGHTHVWTIDSRRSISPTQCKSGRMNKPCRKKHSESFSVTHFSCRMCNIKNSSGLVEGEAESLPAASHINWARFASLSHKLYLSFHYSATSILFHFFSPFW